MDVRPLRRMASLAAVLAASVLILGCGPQSSADAAPNEGSGAAGSAAPATTDAAPAPAAAATASDAPTPAQTPASTASQQPPTVTVYKSPTCGCCESWIEHLRKNGFKVEVKNTPDIESVKNMLGVPPKLRSCHTAIVANYLVEGHVPASDIERLLAERPQIAGLAAPGMPIGAPGMEVEGQPAQHYDVMAFDADGKATVFQAH